MKKQKPIKIIPKNDKEWLEIKKHKLGGSELAAALGLNPYLTPYELWLIKTGRKEFGTSTIQMRRGNCFEDGMVKLWEMETGHVAIKSSAKNILYVHPKYDFISCTPDRRFYYKGNKKDIRVLEVKTSFARYEEPLEQWIIQLYHEINLTGVLHGELLWEYQQPLVCFKNMEFEANYNLQEKLIEMAVEWWTDYVIGDKEPPLTTSGDILLKFPNEVSGKVLEANDEISDTIFEAKEIQEELKRNEEKLNEYKTKVQLVMLDNEKIMREGQTLCTWKANKNGSRVFRITC